MSKNVALKELGDLITLQRGYDLPEQNRRPGPYPVISSAGISGFHDEFKVDGSGVITGRYGTLGEVYFVNGKYWPHNTTLYVKDFKGNDPKYIYYLLKCLGHIKTSEKSAVPGVNRNELHAMAVPVIEDKEKQIAVAKALDLIDIKIALNKEINLDLEQMAKTLYDYWFMQFDFPDKNGKPYKSSGGEMVWSEKLKKVIPKDWKAENIVENSLAELIKPGIKTFQGKKRYLTTSDVVGTDINFQANSVDYATRESRANMQPIANSVWFAKMKNTKKVMFVGEYSDYLTNNFIFSTGFAGIKCMNERALEYILGCVNSDAFESLKDRLSNGATQEAINNESMKSIPLLVPTGDILEKYHQQTYQIHKTIYLREIENEQLANLRDWLLPMLMNGQAIVK